MYSVEIILTAYFSPSHGNTHTPKQRSPASERFSILSNDLRTNSGTREEDQYVILMFPRFNITVQTPIPADSLSGTRSILHSRYDEESQGLICSGDNI
jgi:hypothetical protein